MESDFATLNVRRGRRKAQVCKDCINWKEVVSACPYGKETWVFMGVITNEISQGMLLSLSSIMLPALLSPDSNINVDLNTASWIVSIIGAGGILGFMLSAVIMESYGRKRAYIFSVTLGIIGWMCVYFATTVPVILIGRLLGGVSNCSTASIGSVVIGEYTNPRIRGMFLNLKVLGIWSGILLVHVLGHFLYWKTVILVPFTLAITSFVIVYTWPESPSWFASKNKLQDCERTFYWLRGKSTDSVHELKELIKAQQERHLNKPVAPTRCARIKQFLKKMTRKDFVKPIFIIILCGLLLESSGAHYFPGYALQIIEEITGSKSDAFYCTLAFDIVIFMGVMFSSVLVRYLKKRTIIFSTGFLSFLVLYFLSLYIFLASKNVISKERTYIPVAFLGIYLVLNSLGSFTVTVSLLGEIFPLEHKESATCISSSFLALILMSGMQVAPHMLANFKVHGTFAVTGVMMFVMLVSLWFVLPETKDKTLQEIENYFNYGKYSAVDCEADKEKMLMNTTNKFNTN